MRETAISITDGCHSLVLDPRDGPRLVTSADVNGVWNIISDGSYADDLIGYGPATARFYQNLLPSNGSCSLSLQQGMQINITNGFQSYATNSVTLLIKPTSVTVTRAGITATKDPYPVQ